MTAETPMWATKIMVARHLEVCVNGRPCDCLNPTEPDPADELPHWAGTPDQPTRRIPRPDLIPHQRTGTPPGHLFVPTENRGSSP